MLQINSNPASIETVTYAVHLLGAILSLLLFALSLYAWSRRRNASLIFVSAAFFVFFVLIFLDEILAESPLIELLGGVFELVILLLFFLTVVVGVGRRNREPEKEIDTEGIEK